MRTSCIIVWLLCLQFSNINGQNKKIRPLVKADIIVAGDYAGMLVGVTAGISCSKLQITIGPSIGDELGAIGTVSYLIQSKKEKTKPFIGLLAFYDYNKDDLERYDNMGITLEFGLQQYLGKKLFCQFSLGAGGVLQLYRDSQNLYPRNKLIQDYSIRISTGYAF